MDTSMETTQPQQPREQSELLTTAEKKVRDRFVLEYLKDYSPMEAVIRIGYDVQFADHMAKKFMSEPYTLNRIQELEENQTDTDEVDQHKKRLIGILYREANYMGAGSSHSGRVAAAGRLATLLGVDAPTKSVATVKLEDGGPNLDHLSVEEIEDLKKKLYVSTSPTTTQ